jgi:hypothetical protein
MNEFPTIVYKCPGACFGPPGTTFNSVGVKDEKELAKRLADGWFKTLPEAVEAFLNPVQVEPPPTREEMLEQAEKIGLKVDKRWSDETLLEKINEKM